VAATGTIECDFSARVGSGVFSAPFKSVLIIMAASCGGQAIAQGYDPGSPQWLLGTSLRPEGGSLNPC
jgi:hypothetical protein